MLELNRIYNMDCMEGMKDIPDESIDLIITSPPYNLGNAHHTGGIRHQPYNDDLPEDKYQAQQAMVINECYRVLKQKGSMFYNHKNRIKEGFQISPYEWLLRTKFKIKQEVVWFNGSQNFDKIRFYPMTERVYWLAKEKDTGFYNSINHHDFFDTQDWGPEGTGKVHKRAFPTKMVRDILSCFEESKTVLDPYMGSGSTAVACINLKRKYIGFEIDKEYFEAANKRIEAVKAQVNIFDVIGR